VLSGSNLDCSLSDFCECSPILRCELFNTDLLDDNPEVKSVIVGHRAKCVWLKRNCFETTENVHELIIDVLFRNCTICIEQASHDIQQVMMAVTLSRTESSIGVHDQSMVNI
jgi:hypothetical protein